VLFRQEALESASAKSLGEVISTKPPGHNFLTALFTAIGVSIVAFFCLASYTRKVDVSGVLLPAGGLIHVVNSQAGVIVSRSVDEGKPVREGDVLFVVRSDRSSPTQGDAAKAVTALLNESLRSLRQDQQQLSLQAQDRLRASARKVEQLKSSLPLLDQQIVLQQQKLAIANDNYRRFHDLQDSHFVSVTDVQQRQTELLEQRLRLSASQRDGANAQQELATAEAALGDQKIQASRDQETAKRNILLTRQELTENEARREVQVLAPAAGVVSNVMVNVGQSVTASQTLAVVVPPDSPMEADLYAPSKAVGFLKAGMAVRLRYDSFSYQQFGLARGSILEVANTPIRPEEIELLAGGIQPGDKSVPVYHVRVKLEQQSVNAYGAALRLKAGTKVDASVTVERRRLIEWMLGPLYSISRRL
jgi:membrane fusion protein